MVTFHHYQPVAGGLHAIQQHVRQPQVVHVVRLRQSIGRRVYGELATVQQIPQAHHQVRPEALGCAAEDLQTGLAVVGDVHIAESQECAAALLGHHSSPATMAAVRA